MRKEPAVASVSHLAPIHLGLDVHKDTISVGILRPDQQVPEVEGIAHDEASVRRLLARVPDRAWLRACYEAGRPALSWLGCCTAWTWAGR
jgi:hypothetical protein